jgi:tetratricopeptide (TPR) repeat protein
MSLISSALILVTALVNPSVLLAAQQETDQMAEARHLLIEASHLVKDTPEFQQPSAAANIAGQLVRAADLPDALATVHLLSKAEDQAQATESVAWELAHYGNLSQALALVESTADGQSKGVEYEILAEISADKGDVEGALQLAHRIRNDPDRLVDAIVRVASRLAKVGVRSGAREAIGEALDVAEQAAKQNIGHTTQFTQIATTQAEIGDTAGAFITLDRFSEIARQYKGAEGNSTFLQQLASAQAQIGDVVGAQRTIEEIPPGNSDLALMCISREQAKHGHMVDALANAARISSPGFRASTLQEIAMIRGTHGTLNDALEAIDHIPEPAGRADALATLALEQAENENPAASPTLQMAWKLATQMGADTSDDVLGTIAVTRALLGDFAGAQQIVQEMTKPESRVWPLWNITSFMVRAGHTQVALALAENQDAAYPKAYALLGAAQGILNRLESEERAHTGKQ